MSFNNLINLLSIFLENKESKMNTNALKLEIESIKKNSSPSLEEGKYKIVSFLGNGTFGGVHHIILKENFACKCIDLKKLVKNLQDEQEINEELLCAYSEYSLMRKYYPNVVGSHVYNYNEKTKIFISF